jgi:hypothetical protein
MQKIPMKTSYEDIIFPEIPLDSWESTKNTIHLFLQIVGKIRLKTFPKMNHWWNVTLYVSPMGLTTRAIPYKNSSFEIEFNFVDHKLEIKKSSGEKRQFSLENISVAEFYKKIFNNLNDVGIEIEILAVPYDVQSIATIPFIEDHKNAAYDKLYAKKMWEILVLVNNIFEEFRGRFIGKSTPVQLYWHHFDLALTRFSGREAPRRDGANMVEREAYSHEVISFGFWFGDENVREPAFYAYLYPMTEDLMKEQLNPGKAFWNEQAGLALLMYSDVLKSESPKKIIMDFLENVYQVCAKKSNWNIESFRLKQ